MTETQKYNAELIKAMNWLGEQDKIGRAHV